MKGTSKEEAVRAEQDRRADPDPRDTVNDESEQQIDEIVERHRETLDRLARD